MSASYKDKLKPSLSETFKGIIWKVETDDKKSIVAIESRDLANRITHFSAFDYENGTCFFKEITVEDGWFWSLDRVHSGIIFLHGYVNESNPEHKGIIAINDEGEIAWQQFHNTLAEVTDKGLVVYNPKIQPKMASLISPLNGEVLSARVMEFTPVERQIDLPDSLDSPEILQHLLPENLIGTVYHSSVNDKHIVVFHTKSGDLHNQQLIVVQQENILLEDYLATDIQKLNPEAFFIERGHLFYIRNDKREFVSYLV